MTDEETPVEPMNREQRRHPEKLEELQRQGDHPPRPEDENPSASPDETMLNDDRQQDDYSVRAKNTGHGKKTADKWNQ